MQGRARLLSVSKWGAAACLLGSFVVRLRAGRCGSAWGFWAARLGPFVDERRMSTCSNSYRKDLMFWIVSATVPATTSKLVDVLHTPVRAPLMSSRSSLPVAVPGAASAAAASMTVEHADLVVVGAGQSGLATAHAALRAGLQPVVLEADRGAAGSWPRYYDSLTLFSPARYSRSRAGRFPATRSATRPATRSPATCRTTPPRSTPTSASGTASTQVACARPWLRRRDRGGQEAERGPPGRRHRRLRAPAPADPARRGDVSRRALHAAEYRRPVGSPDSGSWSSAVGTPACRSPPSSPRLPA